MLYHNANECNVDLKNALMNMDTILVISWTSNLSNIMQFLQKAAVCEKREIRYNFFYFRYVKVYLFWEV